MDGCRDAVAQNTRRSAAAVSARSPALGRGWQTSARWLTLTAPPPASTIGQGVATRLALGAGGREAFVRRATESLMILGENGHTECALCGAALFVGELTRLEISISVNAEGTWIRTMRYDGFELHRCALPRGYGEGTVQDARSAPSIQTDTVLSANLGPGSAHEAAICWRRHVFEDRDMGAAWRWIDRDFQMALIQAWIVRSDGAPDDRQVQAVCRREGSDWDSFASATLRRWLDVWPDGVVHWPTLTPFDLWTFDIEVVSFTPGSVGPVFSSGQLLPVMALPVRLRQGWGIAGIGPCIAVPGWPPTELDLW
jgi:hypothetical protein